MKSVFKCSTVLAAALLAISFAQAEASDAELKVSELVQQGWRDYQYREFDTAKSIFSEAAKRASAKDDKVQALTGQAFCLHFGKRALASAADFETAKSLYSEALQLVEDSNPQLAAIYKNLIAECDYRIYVINGDEDKLKAAESAWKDLQESRPDSLGAQEAALYKNVFRTKTYKEAYESEAFKETQASFGAKLKKSPAPGPDAADAGALDAVMANYLSLVCYWSGDYKGASRWLKDYIKLGPTSYSAKVTAYFKVARLSELKNGDLKEAAQYYAMFAKNFPVDARRYFCELKAAELQDALKKENR